MGAEAGTSWNAIRKIVKTGNAKTYSYGYVWTRTFLDRLTISSFVSGHDFSRAGWHPEQDRL
jgi:hypothetical protein